MGGKFSPNSIFDPFTRFLSSGIKAYMNKNKYFIKIEFPHIMNRAKLMKKNVFLIFFVFFTCVAHSQNITIKNIQDIYDTQTLANVNTVTMRKQIVDNFHALTGNTFYIDGNKLVFIDKGEKTTIDLQSKHITNLYHEKWNHAGDKICAVARDIDYKNQFYITIISNNGNIQLIKSESALGSFVMPAFSFDDKYLAYVENSRSFPSQKCKLKIRNLEPNEIITVDIDDASLPVWFHKSNKLIYQTMDYNVSTKEITTKLFIYNLADGVKIKIFEDIMSISYPLLSPNDSLIAIQVKEGTKIINFKGELLNFLSGDENGGYMKWAPNSKYLSYINGTFGYNDVIKSLSLYTVNINNKNIVNLTPLGNLKDFSTCWINDSSILAVTK